MTSYNGCFARDASCTTERTHASRRTWRRWPSAVGRQQVPLGMVEFCYRSVERIEKILPFHVLHKTKLTTDNIQFRQYQEFKINLKRIDTQIIFLYLIFIRTSVKYFVKQIFKYRINRLLYLFGKIVNKCFYKRGKWFVHQKFCLSIICSIPLNFYFII